MISLIHPSRGRPEKSYITIQKWLINARHQHQIEVVVSCDEDDSCIFTYNKLYCFKNIINKNKSAVDAINKAADFSGGEIMIIISDDTDCPLNWDDYLIKFTEGKTDWILKTQDGIQPWIITMPIMDRVYYNRFGYIYHPDYLHMFCDTELTCVADITGRKLTSNLL